ncbi:MAG: ribonuclease E/G [Rhodospirillaceae bacterium]|nr:ribonuclease E/G [Rhodospirillaceae bacterium]
MATKRMLIDASHPEETRVLIVNNTRLEDFDVEVERRRQLKGNIYLAKVTRVEPSLQAAFVDFGGNRHGFLAFNEIHPDYYQIPVADRETLIAEARADAASNADDDDEAAEEAAVETLGGDDSEEIEARRPASLRRHYKVQEVIKRRQILLIQVVKEERGTKGAALTTYLSLAGRYCVLMPNTDRGGGISRKISNAPDRKRLKSVVNELGIPEGMAVIVRTAGSKRSKAEIRRDYDYLLRLWNQVRDMTLGSIAPCLVHEEGDLIKRSIRDLYTKEIDEIIIHGEDGYRMAKDFMKILIPSHAKKVQRYKDEGVPLNHKYQIDGQLDAIHSPEVHMKSGAYIVINPTEALVSIDVNSGRATKQRNIEETALRTNIDAAEEIARQLRLRDLAGLIVIDFIDMENHRNQVKVERALKEAMRPDRARIQIGRISPFGLLELSRQRLRPSLIETSSEPCPYCEGTGVRRSTDTTAVEVIRAIEEEGMRKRDGVLTVHVATSVALFVLNQKRQSLAEVEGRYGLTVLLENDDTLIPPAMRIDREGESESIMRTGKSDGRGDDSGDDGSKHRRKRRPRRRGKRDDADISSNAATEDETTEETVEAAATTNTEETETTANPDDKDSTRRRRRGRRGGRKRKRRTEETEGTAIEAAEGADSAAPSDGEPILIEGPATTELLAAPEEAAPAAIALPDQSEDRTAVEAEAKAAEKPKRRRRTKKADAEESAESATADTDTDAEAEQAAEPAKKPRRRRTTKTATKADKAATDETETSTETGDTATADAPAEKPKRRRKAAAKPTAAAEAEVVKPEPSPEPKSEPELSSTAEADNSVVEVGASEQATEKPRRGWWQRASAD